MPESDKRRALTLAKEIKARKYYRQEPIDWIVDRLKIKREMIQWSLLPEYQNHKWDGMADPLVKILDAIKNNHWCGVEGGTGTSKTFLAACISLWFWESFEDAMVIITSPREKQLDLGTWKNLRFLHPILGRGEMQTLSIKHSKFPDWKIEGLVAGIRAAEKGQSATRMQSIHAEHLLFVLDECPGIDNAIITALQNTCVAPHNLILALGNPDHQLDPLHRFCQLNRTKFVTISGFDYPNVVLKNPKYIPGGQTEQGLSDMLDRYGSIDNPLYLSRARGISPAQATDSLIRLEWLIAARDRERVFDGIPSMGVDVANSENGDKAAIAFGHGSMLENVESFQCPNSNKLGEDVWNRMRQDSIRPEYIGVDGIGVGAGTINKLIELEQYVLNIQSGGASIEIPEQIETFNNLRSQMWWQFRLDVQSVNSKICLPDDEELFADLIAPKYSIQGGKICVESKDTIRKRLTRSPNKGDAVVYWNWARTDRTGGITTKDTHEVEIEELEAITVVENY